MKLMVHAELGPTSESQLDVVGAITGHIQSAMGTKWKEGSVWSNGIGGISQGSGLGATPEGINRNLAGGKEMPERGETEQRPEARLCPVSAGTGRSTDGRAGRTKAPGKTGMGGKGLNHHDKEQDTVPRDTEPPEVSSQGTPLAATAPEDNCWASGG